MKFINKSALKTFEKIVSQLKEDSVKIGKKDGAFMQLICERVGSCKQGQLISLAHYYEQNGDLMADPEMVFVYEPGKYAYPVSYKLDGLGKYVESVVFKDGEPTSYYKAIQADHVFFANMWLKNIKFQQGL